MDVLISLDSSTFAPYLNVAGKNQDPTSGGNVLAPFLGDPSFSGATLYPIGSTSRWTPAVSPPPWIMFTPLWTAML